MTNPEQEARAAVTTAMSEHHAYHCTPTERLPSHAIKDCPAIMPALDRLCTERYLAGKVEAMKRVAPLCAEPPDWLTCEDRLTAVIAAGGQGGLCQVHDLRQKYEAEYAACVAALQEAKHG